MNGLHRRLLKAFVQGGGDLGDGRDLDRFAAIVRSNVLLLTARTRRAVELALEGGEEISYDDIATRLAEQEGGPVTVASVRQRVSRGGRSLEMAVRRSVQSSGVAMPSTLQTVVPRGAAAASANGRRSSAGVPY